MIEVAILLVLGTVVCFCLYRNAEKIRVSVLEMRIKEPLKFKILGFSKRTLDDPETWLRHYRMFIISLCAFLYLFGLWFFATVK